MFKNKKLLIYLLIPVFVLVLSACSSIEEDYFIYSDGSVIFQQKNDLSQFLAMMAEEEEMSEAELVEAELEWEEDMCQEKPDNAIYYNCFMKEEVAYQQTIFQPKYRSVEINDGIYEISLYDFSDIFEMAGDSEEDQIPEEMGLSLEARFIFEGEVLYSDLGEISANTVLITLDDLKAMEEGQEVVVRARIDENIEHFEDVMYKSQLKDDGSIYTFWPYVPKEYISKAQEVFDLSENELHEQIIKPYISEDGVVDDDLGVYVEKIANDYFLAWPIEEKLNLMENNEGNLEISIMDALYFDVNDVDNDLLNVKYEIEFFSDIISADLGTISANILSFNLDDAGQLKSDSKVVISKNVKTSPKLTKDQGRLVYVRDSNMHSNLKGKILLQVEANGEAYYIHPEKLEMFSLGRPDDAFTVMREQGIGISNDNLLKIPTADTNALKNTFGGVDSDGDGYDDYTELMNNYNSYGAGRINYDLNFASKNAGKIFLQVEANGEAWYVNGEDNKRYFLGRPNDAFEIMRTLGLGISNENLNKLIY